MKKYLIWAAIILAVAAAFWVQHVKIKRLTEERDRYRSNTEILLQDVKTYQTKDSLNAIKVGNLELSLAEYKKVPGGRSGVDKDVAGKEPGFGTGYNNPNGNNQRIAGNRPG